MFDDEAILNGTNEWLQSDPDMGMRVSMPNMTLMMFHIILATI